MSDDSVHPEDVTTEPKSALGHLLYISEAVRAFTRAELNAIRETSARNNAKRGVSGVLFYSRGHFVQLLEGDMGVI
ncbi:MAG: BLUF domain-containing protein, partial [Planctomycetota bacterium]